MPLQFTTPGELAQVRAAGRLAWTIIQQLVPMVRPGVATVSIAQRAQQLIEESGATPTTKGFVWTDDDAQPFPHAVSVCINDEVMFGVPGEREIAPGDLVTLDVTLRTGLGWCADVATSIPVGPGGRSERLVAAGHAAVASTLTHAQPGAWWSDVMAHTSAAVGALGLHLAPGPTGHGIGRSVHEDPWLFASPAGSDVRLRPGMVLCVEPVVLERPDKTVPDGPWTVKTVHDVWSAFEERMIAITPGGPELLTQ